MSVDATLLEILAQLKDMKASQEEMGGKISNLETEVKREENAHVEDGNNKKDDIYQNQGANQRNAPAQGSSREKYLSMTFGSEECTPTALRLFLDHYEIAKEQNTAKGIIGWDNSRFRANEIRFQLRGEPALWIGQECAMLNSTWTRDDEEIVKQLRERYMGTQCVELNIIAFEEVSQEDSESLAAYMTRCQRRGFEAFSEMDPASTQQRIVWKFLSGIRDLEVRSEVIKQKWMQTAGTAKSFEEVLLIAETARRNKVAASVTGPPGGPRAKVAGVAAMKSSRVKERRSGRHGSGDSASSNFSNSSKGSSASSKSNSSGTVNFRCHYCNTTEHFGGWKFCPKRNQENPSWNPGSTEKRKGFQ